MQDYTKLLVWQRARALTVVVHAATRQASGCAAPGLQSQLLRAVMAIGANIVHGASRDTRAEFVRCVAIAIGAAGEAEYHLTVCADLGIIEQPIADLLIAQITDVRRMLFGLRRALVMHVQQSELGFGMIATDPSLLH